jgi:hypothetical protein
MLSVLSDSAISELTHRLNTPLFRVQYKRACGCMYPGMHVVEGGHGPGALPQATTYYVLTYIRKYLGK